MNKNKSFRLQQNINISNIDENISDNIQLQSEVEKIENKEASLITINPNKDVSLEKNILYQCDICKQMFTDIDFMSHYIHIDTPKEISDNNVTVCYYVCNICKKTFTRKYDMIRHSKCHTPQMLYVCGFCRKTYMRKDHFIKHTLMHIKRKNSGISIQM